MLLNVIAQIHLQALDVRLSYNDVQLFLAIAKSIPSQANSMVVDASALDARASASASPTASWLNGSSASDTNDTPQHTLDPVLGMDLF